MLDRTEQHRLAGEKFYAIVQENFAAIIERVTAGDTLNAIVADLGVRRTHLTTVLRNDADKAQRFEAAMAASAAIRKQHRADNMRRTRLEKAEKQRAFVASYYGEVLSHVAHGLSVAAACKAIPNGPDPKQIEAALRRDPEFHARFRQASRHLKSDAPLTHDVKEAIIEGVAQGKTLIASAADHGIEYARFLWHLSRDPLLAKKLSDARLVGARLRPSRSLQYADEILSRMEAGETLPAICASDRRYPDPSNFRSALKRYPILLNRYELAMDAERDRMRASINGRKDSTEVLTLIEKAIPPDHELRDDFLSETFIAFSEGRIRIDEIAAYVKSLVNRDISERKHGLSLDEPMGSDSITTRGDMLAGDW
ncbi:MAG: hypothetical protein M9932_01820 [Xanthobacteraceae bacterium]|nr:hypothetical protein [Xanthobacteraceae bacterium]